MERTLRHGKWGWALLVVLLFVVGPSAVWPAETNTFPLTGNVGIGTTTPTQLLQVQGGTPSITLKATTGTFRTYISSGGSGSFVGANVNPFNAYLDDITKAGWSVGYGVNGDYYNITHYTAGANPRTGTTYFRINSLGDVGIGTATPAAKLHVLGDAIVSGNIAAKYQDVAEWVPTKSALVPGTVVVIDPNERNQVLPAAKPYDTRVAGVVSAQPGLLLGEAGDNKVKVAHNGRVAVKVDASYGSIAVGDLLVTSPTAGHAMRSTPVDLGGVPIHRPGTLVGKALEPLAEGQGEILVLLTLQ